MIFPRKKKDREAWLDEQCHELKHKRGAAARILKDVKDFVETNTVSIVTMLLDINYPIIQAPMAGGATGYDLVLMLPLK